MRFRGDQTDLFKMLKVAKITKVDMASCLGIFPQNVNRYALARQELPEEGFNALLDLLFDRTGEDFEDKKIG